MFTFGDTHFHYETGRWAHSKVKLHSSYRFEILQVSKVKLHSQTLQLLLTLMPIEKLLTDKKSNLHTAQATNVGLRGPQTDLNNKMHA